MIQNYEFTCIFLADEEKMKEGLDLVQEAFAKSNVKITKQDDLGVKTLAYEINKQDKGHYVYFELECDTQVIKELSRAFQLSSLVLKFLFINVEHK